MTVFKPKGLPGFRKKFEKISTHYFCNTGIQAIDIVILNILANNCFYTSYYRS
jgi:hypothetical protein